MTVIDGDTNCGVSAAIFGHGDMLLFIEDNCNGIISAGFPR